MIKHYSNAQKIKKSLYTVLQKLVIFSSLFCLSCLVASFSRTSQRPEISPGKKEHLLLAVTKLMTKACPGAISLVLFFCPKNLSWEQEKQNYIVEPQSHRKPMSCFWPWQCHPSIHPSRLLSQLAQISRVLTNKTLQCVTYLSTLQCQPRYKQENCFWVRVIIYALLFFLVTGNNL